MHRVTRMGTPSGCVGSDSHYRCGKSSRVFVDCIVFVGCLTVNCCTAAIITRYKFCDGVYYTLPDAVQESLGISWLVDLSYSNSAVTISALVLQLSRPQLNRKQSTVSISALRLSCDWLSCKAKAEMLTALMECNKSTRQLIPSVSCSAMPSSAQFLKLLNVHFQKLQERQADECKNRLGSAGLLTLLYSKSAVSTSAFVVSLCFWLTTKAEVLTALLEYNKVNMPADPKRCLQLNAWLLLLELVLLDPLPAALTVQAGRCCLSWCRLILCLLL